MAKKKNKTVPISQGDITQAQSVLAQFHDIAEKIHESGNPEQVMTALSEIEGLPEATQIAVLKALAKEQDTDAADVVNALNGFATLKSVRKEAKRALIQLQGAKIYPKWEQPTVSALREFEVVKSSHASITPSDDFLPEFFDDDDDEDDYEEINLKNLSPQMVVTRYIENWVRARYHIVYQLLTKDSPILQNLGEDAWVKKREVWAKRVKPANLGKCLIDLFDSKAAKLWFPELSGAKMQNSHYVLDATWSIELKDADLSKAAVLPEFPKASSWYKETGRHWFWFVFVLVKEQGEWRIQSITNQIANVEKLSIEELRANIQKCKDMVDAIKNRIPAKLRTHMQENQIDEKEEAQVEQFMTEISIHMMHLSHFFDTLVKKTEVEKALYTDVSTAMIIANQIERGLLYIEMMIQRFEDQRAENLRTAANLKEQLSELYFENMDDQRGQHFLELAERDLKESLSIEDNEQTRISLAEMYIENERFDEAEEYLLPARTMTSDAADLAHIEMHLGQVATEQGRFADALAHCQRELELRPDLADAWADVGEAYNNLDDIQAADEHFRHAIELNPEKGEFYAALSNVYDRHGLTEQSMEVLEDGMKAIPDSTALAATLATKFMLAGDYQQAEIYVNKLASMDPKFPMLPLMRASLTLEKAQSPRPPRVVESKRNVKDTGPFRLSRPTKKKR